MLSDSLWRCHVLQGAARHHTSAFHIHKEKQSESLFKGCLNAHGQVGGIVTYFRASFKVVCLPVAGGQELDDF